LRRGSGNLLEDEIFCIKSHFAGVIAFLESDDAVLQVVPIMIDLLNRESQFRGILAGDRDTGAVLDIHDLDHGLADILGDSDEDPVREIAGNFIWLFHNRRVREGRFQIKILIAICTMILRRRSEGKAAREDGDEESI
jgi:hypothetical protein